MSDVFDSKKERSLSQEVIEKLRGKVSLVDALLVASGILSLSQEAIQVFIQQINQGATVEVATQAARQQDEKDILVKIPELRAAKFLQ